MAGARRAVGRSGASALPAWPGAVGRQPAAGSRAAGARVKPNWARADHRPAHLLANGQASALWLRRATAPQTGLGAAMHLTPREQEKLLIFVAAELARKRQ